MDPGVGVAFDKNLRFSGGKFRETIFDGGRPILGRREAFGQSDIGRVVASFRLEQPTEERRQLFIFQVIAELGEAFAATSFDDSRDKQPIDGPARLVLANQFVEPAAVAAGAEAPEANATLLEQVEHHVKMFELLVDDLGHFAAELLVFDVGEDQVHGRGCGLFFAMGVVDQHVLKMDVDLIKPALASIGGEVKHGSQYSAAGIKRGEGAPQASDIGGHFRSHSGLIAPVSEQL